MEKEFAFPTVGKFARDKRNEVVIEFFGGMTLLDYFAAKAMQQLIKNSVMDIVVAKTAYDMAEAMMKERQKRIVKE